MRLHGLEDGLKGFSGIKQVIHDDFDLVRLSSRLRLERIISMDQESGLIKQLGEEVVIATDRYQ